MGENEKGTEENDEKMGKSEKVKEENEKCKGKRTEKAEGKS